MLSTWFHRRAPSGNTKHAARSQSPPKGPEKWCRAKLVEKCRKTFWHFLTIFAIFCPAGKLSKNFWYFLTIFDVFWRGPFPPAPFAIRWCTFYFADHLQVSLLEQLQREATLACAKQVSDEFRRLPSAMAPKRCPPSREREERVHANNRERGEERQTERKKDRKITWPQLGPFFVPACPPLTAINGY